MRGPFRYVVHNEPAGFFRNPCMLVFRYGCSLKPAHVFSQPVLTEQYKAHGLRDLYQHTIPKSACCGGWVKIFIGKH